MAGVPLGPESFTFSAGAVTIIAAPMTSFRVPSSEAASIGTVGLAGLLLVPLRNALRGGGAKLSGSPSARR